MKRSVNKNKSTRRLVRHSRVRSKVKGTLECPRISVFRGLRKISVQFIDDKKAHTLCSAASDEVKMDKTKVEGKTGKVALAYLTGKLAAERAKEKGVVQAVFDRGGYRYHGRVAAIAEGIRQGGIKF